MINDPHSQSEIASKISKDLHDAFVKSVEFLEENLGEENIGINSVFSGIVFFVSKVLVISADTKEELNEALERFNAAVISIAIRHGVV